MKTKSPGPGHPGNPSQEALDQKITHLTEEVAKTANRFKVPILVGLVAIIAIVALTQLVSYLSKQAQGDRSAEVYSLFLKEPAELRAAAPGLAKSLEGTSIEPAFVVRYASWLFEQSEPGDRESAMALVAAAKSRHPESILLGLLEGELEQVRAKDEGFELPPLPEPPPANDPLDSTAPVTPGNPVPVPPAGAGETGGATAESGDGDSAEPDAAPPEEPAPAPTPDPAPGEGGR